MLTAHSNGFGVGPSSRMGFALGDRAQHLEMFGIELARKLDSQGKELQTTDSATTTPDA